MGGIGKQVAGISNEGDTHKIMTPLDPKFPNGICKMLSTAPKAAFMDNGKQNSYWVTAKLKVFIH
jgi:hypothetical protein